MKIVFTFGLLAIYLHVSIAKIIPIPGKFVEKHPFPNHGECFRNTEIMCSQAGVRVQYGAENCVDCTCDGDNEGITCCNLEPFPVVKKKEECEVRLNTTTCLYKLTPKNVDDKHACCIIGYEIADIEWTPEAEHPGRPAESNANVEKVEKAEKAEKAVKVEKAEKGKKP